MARLTSRLAVYRPVLIIDEAQEMNPPVLSELRLLSSADLDSRSILTIVLAGDQRLASRLGRTRSVAHRQPHPRPLASGSPAAQTTPGMPQSPAQSRRQSQAPEPITAPDPLRTRRRQPPPAHEHGQRSVGRRLAIRNARSIDEKLFFEVFALDPKPARKIMNPLPVQRASQLSTAGPQTQWLVEGLWSDQAVGILGGEPKCYKSFLALDIAVSVASGTACLRQFPVRRTGKVLLFPAEDSLAIVRQRLEGIAAAGSGQFPRRCRSKSSPLPRSGWILRPTASAWPTPSRTSNPSS